MTTKKERLSDLVLAQINISSKCGATKLEELYRNPAFRSVEFGLPTTKELEDILQDLKKKEMIRETSENSSAYIITPKGKKYLNKVINDSSAHNTGLEKYFPHLLLEKRLEAIEIALLSALVIFLTLSYIQAPLGPNESKSIILIWIFIILMSIAWLVGIYQAATILSFATSTVLNRANIYIFDSIFRYLNTNRKVSGALAIVIIVIIGYFGYLLFGKILPEQVSGYVLTILTLIIGSIIKWIHKNWMDKKVTDKSK